MDTKYEEHGQWGFTRPEPGWYLMQIGDEITDRANDAGKITLRIPLKIVDGEYQGAQQSIYITLNPASDGESRANKAKVGRLIGAIGLKDKFEAAFPGNISPLDDEVIKRLKQVLPGKSIMVRLDEDKTGKYLNVLETAPAGYKPNQGKAKQDSPEPKNEW